MGTLWQDVRYGARVLLKSPGFALVSVLTLALGIGANTGVFSVVSAVLVRPLGYPEPERLVKVWEDESANGLFARGTVAAANYLDWKAQNQTLAGMAASEFRAFNLTGDGEPDRVIANGVTANYFSLVGVRPALGRDFLPEEDRPGGERTVILGHGLWQSRYGADPAVLNRNLLLNGEAHRVVGVMPAGFEFGGAKLWTPLALTNDQLTDRSWHNLEVVARLKAGVTAEQANADLRAITARIAAAYPDDAQGLSAAVVPLRDELVGDARRPLALLLGAVGLVLLIACANTAGMLLARAAARRREIAVRCALGAGRLRIVRQLLTESLLLGAAGGLLGLLLAVWSFAFLRQLVPAGMREATELQLDAPVLLFTLGVSLLAGLGFGLAPALQASRTDLNDALKSNTARAGFGGRSRRLRDAFVVAQVALSLVLLVGAGLLVQTLSKLRGQYAELQPERVLTVRTQLSDEKYEEHARRTDFYERVLGRVRGLPGVEAAGYATAVPLAWKGGANGLQLEGKQPTPGLAWNAIHRQATPDYFRAIGIAVKEGRAFTEADNETGMPVAVINEAMARLYWPGESALGKRFKIAGPSGSDIHPWRAIVGVVADVRQMGADAPVRAEAYIPQRQAGAHPFHAPRDLVVRASIEPLGLAAAVREAIREADPAQPMTIRTMDEVLGRETAQRRLGATLVLSFAALALLLAALGIYGVLAYFVTQHVPEIGVRLALGARPADILGLVLWRGMSLALIGLAVGLAAAYALTRLMTGLLFGVEASDPLTYAAVATVIAAVALAACLIPARRAMKIDPMEALRYE